MSETDEPSTELCGETNQSIGWNTILCGLAKDHGGDRHVPDPGKPNAGWWRTEPTYCRRPLPGFGFEPPLCGLPRGHEGECASPDPAVPALVCSAVLEMNNGRYACRLPQGHSEKHEDGDLSRWDITWTRPQSARMDAPAPPLTFSRDRRDEELDDIRTRLEALENGTGRQINIHDFDRIMGRVTATLDAIGRSTVPDSLNEVNAKLNEILTRLGPTEPPRCGDVRPYLGSHGRSGEPNPDDLCVRPEGHTDRHVNGTATWPNTVMHVSDRCEIKHPETGHPCWQLVGPNVQEHTAHRTAYGSVWESERTHDADCEREPEHGTECCSHPNGVGPNGCAGCGDYRQD